MENQTFDNSKLLSDDELVAMFFEENRQELSDDGFTQRVMEQLPSRSVRLNRIWTVVCSLLGIVFFILADGLTQLKLLFANAFGNLGGFVSSVDFTGLSPLMILAALTVCSALVAWNFMADRKVFWR
ncbi:MAG: DUF5056 domain-containing protein [Prevotella sp.]|nr:DUF5056 domain-containing protein [Prevotella sp.]MBR5036264.1 DUF5056 domain-containing protein [Prevotella sp.]